MTHVSRVVAVLLLSLAFSACTNIPPESITVNQKVSEKVVVQRDNALAILEAYRQSLHTVVEEKFDDIYDKMEKVYRQKRGIGSRSLTSSQQKDVAALTYIAMTEANKRIDMEIDKQVGIIASNSRFITDSNDTVTKLLQSAAALQSQREQIANDVQQASGVDLDQVSKIVDNAVNAGIGIAGS